MVEVTERCDVGCTTCSASSIIAGLEAPGAEVVEAALAEADAVRANVVALSGGEPLMRPDIWAIADAIHCEIPRLVLITSGRGFESDAGILAAIGERASWLEVYLQFDSLDDGVLKTIRAAGVEASTRRRRLAQAVATGAKTTAVCVVPSDADPSSIGTLAAYCRDEGAAGITFQPLRQLGRYPVAGGQASASSTVDYIQGLALRAIGSPARPRPLVQQPFDICVNFVGSSAETEANTFFQVQGERCGFRIATSSYWDSTNYYEPFAEIEPYYFMAAPGLSLNARYLFDVRLGSRSIRKSATAYSIAS